MKENFITLSEPTLTGDELESVTQTLREGWVSTFGPTVERFETALKERLGVSHAVGVSNGSSGLHAALLACDVGADAAVLMPTITFAAPANAIRYVGAHPIFIDVSPETWHIDIAKTEKFLKEECEVKGETTFQRKTGRPIKALLLVHILGLCCDIEPLLKLARQFHLKVIEDACEGLGVLYRGKAVGTFGDVGIFSFNGNKIITAGAGGVVVSDNPEIAARIRHLTTQAKSDPIEYIHDTIGFNYRLSNLHAAVGLAQLKHLDTFISKRRSIWEFYREHLEKISGVTMMPVSNDCTPTCWLSTVLLPDSVTLEKRVALVQKLNREGIGVRPIWHPLHSLKPFAEETAYNVHFADALYRRSVSLPSSSHLTRLDLKRVTDAFQTFL